MTRTNIEEEILVRDVMSSPVITADENSCIPLIAQLMKRHNVGCVVVVNRNGEPLGIITERDLVIRVLTKITVKSVVQKILSGDVHLERLTAKDVMSTPLITIGPDETLLKAAREMCRLNIRRLIVMHNNRLAGIISSKDLLSVAPVLIEILREKNRIAEDAYVRVSDDLSIAGYCERCGNWSSNLKELNGNFLCEECII